MKEQLTLINTPPAWHIDDKTKLIGLAGLQQARAALAAAKRFEEEAGSAA